MNVVADKPELLDIKPEHLATYKALVDEAWATFGAFISTITTSCWR
jgi:hypothetical protein